MGIAWCVVSDEIASDGYRLVLLAMKSLAMSIAW